MKPAPHSASLTPWHLVATIVLAHFAFTGNRFIFALHAVSLGATPLGIGCVMAMLMVGPMLLSVHFGRWSDRLGYGRLSALGIAMVLVGCAVAAMSRSLPLLLVASACTGSGYMMAHVAINNAIGRVAPPGQSTRAFSTLALVFSISALGGPFISGFAIDGLGFAVAYITWVFLCVAALVMLKHATRRYPVAPAEAALHKNASVTDLLQDRKLRTVFIVSGLLTTAWDLFIFLAPLHGVASGLSASATGTVVAAFSAGTFVIRIFLPTLAQRLTEWRLIALSLLVTGVGFVLFPLMGTLVPLILVALLLGMSLGVSQPVSMSLVFQASPPGRAGEAVGVRATITSFSQTVLPLLFGGLGAAVGMVSVFWFASFLLVLSGARTVRQPGG